MKLKFKSTKLHITLTIVWVILMIPTFIWLKTSILWIGFMSCYALAVGHLSSYEAAASAGVDEATHKKLNAIAEGLADLMEVLPGVDLKEDAAELKRVVGLEAKED